MTADTDATRDHPELPAVVLGGGVTALSVARSLDCAGIPVDVLDAPHSPARYSRAVRRFVNVGAVEPQQRMLAWLGSTAAPAVVLAGSDEGVELIASHRGELERLGHRPVEGDDDVLLMMLDKAKTYELARRHDIAAPQVVQLRTSAEVEQAAEQLEFPCVLKPVHSHVFARSGLRGKVEFIANPDQLRERVSALNEQGLEMLLTEVIVGASDEFVSYFGYLDQDGQPLLSFTKRKLRQQPPGFGIGTYHQTTDDPEVAATGLRFLQAVGMRGLGNVEFKRDVSDGQLKLIECNARFTMSNELIRRSGCDLALFCYRRAAGLSPPEPSSYRVGMTLWDPVKDARAFLSYRQLGELSALGWVASVAHPQVFPAFRLADPLPAFARLGWMVRHAPAQPRSAATVMSTRSSSGSPTAEMPERGKLAMRSIERLAATGRRGRATAARLDLIRATGVGPLWRRARAEGEFSALLGEGPRDTMYERIWTDAAVACDAQITQLAPGLFELSRDGSRTRVYHQMVELDDPVTLRVALDKSVVHQLIPAGLLPSSERLEWRVTEPAPALAFLAQARGPCVVKPAAGTGGGHGVTPGIETPAELMRARIHAATGGERLLIERQAEGDVYRLLFLDSELLDVVRSVPASVTGDGYSTIEQLMTRENLRRVAAQGRSGLSLLGVNLDTLLTLERAGIKLSSVPAAGQRVTLRRATNNNAAEDNRTWRGEVAPEVIEVARAAAAGVGLRLAGVDVVSPNIAEPLERSGGIVTEVNGTPGLHHHYVVADPQAATPVANAVLERLLAAP
jgi:D-aspartate ligase